MTKVVPLPWPLHTYRINSQRRKMKPSLSNCCRRNPARHAFCLEFSGQVSLGCSGGIRSAYTWTCAYTGHYWRLFTNLGRSVICTGCTLTARGAVGCGAVLEWMEAQPLATRGTQTGCVYRALTAGTTNSLVSSEGCEIKGIETEIPNKRLWIRDLYLAECE